MKYILKVRTLLVLMLFCLSGSTIAQNNSKLNENQEIDTVVVSTNSSRPAVKQGTYVQIISQEKMDALGMDYLHEAVGTFAGVHITDYGGLGGLKTVSVRSLGAHHTAVSYDGIIVSNAQGGQVDIGSFSLDNVDEVSLTIGQGDEIFQSARSFESSGVLKIKSSAPKFTNKNYKIGAQMEVGSFGMLNPTLNFAAQIAKRWSMSVVGDWLKSDGDYPFTLVNNNLVTEEIRNNSDINTLHSELNLYGTVGRRNGKIEIKWYYMDSERGLPGGVIYYNTIANERLWDKNRFVQGSYSVDINDKWSVQSRVKYNYSWNKYADWNNKYQGGYLDYKYTQEEYYASAAVMFKPSKGWSFTYAQDIFENKLVTTLDDCPDPFRLSVLSALAGQYSSERLTVTTSVLGVFNNEWALNDTYEIAPNRRHMSPSLSMSYKIFADKEVRIRASVKDAYRVPTFNDLYYSSMGNTDLTPEKATQYNVGVTYSGYLLPQIFDYVSASMDCYYNKVSDKIVAIPTMFLWKMMNLGEVHIKGVDMNLSTYFTLCDNIKFNLSGNYTFQHAIDVTDQTAKNYRDQIPYTARHSGNIALTCNTKWFDVGYRATIVGQRYSLPQNIAANLIDGYMDQNINISRTFELKELSIKLRAEVLNLCDVNYDVIKYYPMAGRQYKFTLKINY